jgi:hypothetical protein
VNPHWEESTFRAFSSLTTSSRRACTCGATARALNPEEEEEEIEEEEEEEEEEDTPDPKSPADRCPLTCKL